MDSDCNELTPTMWGASLKMKMRNKKEIVSSNSEHITTMTTTDKKYVVLCCDRLN